MSGGGFLGAQRSTLPWHTEGSVEVQQHQGPGWPWQPQAIFWQSLASHDCAAFALVVFLRTLTADISDIMWKNHRQQMGLSFSQCSYMAFSGLIFSREQNITSRPHNRSNHCSLGFSSGQQSVLSCQDNRPTEGTWQLTEPPLATTDWFLVEFWLSMKVWPMWSF